MQHQPATTAEPQPAKRQVDRITQPLRHDSAKLFGAKAHIAVNLKRSRTCKRRLPQRDQPTNTLCHVFGGKCCAGNVLDVRLEDEFIESMSVCKLFAPGRVADFTTVTLTVRQDLDGAQLAGGIDSKPIGDAVRSADDFVDEKVADV